MGLNDPLWLQYLKFLGSLSRGDLGTSIISGFPVATQIASVVPDTEALMSAVPVPDPTFERKQIVLKGDIPSPINPPSGCHFRTRCPYGEAVCSAEEPALIEMSPGHVVTSPNWTVTRQFLL